MTTQRQPDYPIHEMFLNRWSPRAFTAQPITQEELLTMLEAARWAASSYNSQPWRFLYALRDTSAWERFLNLLVPFNQSWAQESSALVFLISHSTMVHLAAAMKFLLPRTRSMPGPHQAISPCKIR
jgi:nitroreductase